MRVCVCVCAVRPVEHVVPRAPLRARACACVCVSRGVRVQCAPPNAWFSRTAAPRAGLRACVGVCVQACVRVRPRASAGGGRESKVRRGRAACGPPCTAALVCSCARALVRSCVGACARVCMCACPRGREGGGGGAEGPACERACSRIRRGWGGRNVRGNVKPLSSALFPPTPARLCAYLHGAHVPHQRPDQLLRPVAAPAHRRARRRAPAAPSGGGAWAAVMSVEAYGVVGSGQFPWCLVGGR